MTLRFFRFDLCEIAALSSDGTARLWKGSDWSEPSHELAKEVMADERAVEIGPEEASRVISAVAAQVRLGLR